jgi:branched-chain amino acid transport system substrate-binding protein
VKRGRWSVAAVAVAGAVVAGCGGGGGDSGKVAALPASSCPTPIVSGGGTPDLLIASDLPLQGASASQTMQMGKAIEFILKQRGFKAGRFRVGYQACDDATVKAASWDAARCVANANAYSANGKVVGVVGTFNSGCAKIELPILNTAGVAMVSPSATYTGLTKAGPGAEAGEPSRYSPTGRRTFARVIAADDVQGAALATYARSDLKLKRVSIVSDGGTAGAELATTFTDRAGKLGLKVAGPGRWNPKAASGVPIARKIAASGADGVFLAGVAGDGAGALVRDLRTVLGPDFPILLGGGFTPVESVAKPIVKGAGASAEGVVMSVPGSTADELTGAGKTFATDFGATLNGAPVQAYTAYAAQAATVLLDAIASSDGTRASVVENVTKAKVTDGILGSFGIDANGDTTAGAVTVYVIKDGRPAPARVVTP